MNRRGFFLAILGIGSAILAPWGLSAQEGRRGQPDPAPVAAEPAARARAAGAKAAAAAGGKVDEVPARVVHVEAAGVLVQVVVDRARADVARVKAARVVAAVCRRARSFAAPLKRHP